MARRTVPPRLHVLAGVNGAGKSSIGGAMIRAKGGNYYNPDEAARELMAANPGLSQTNANAAAWEQGRKLLERAIDQKLDFAFETTLGGDTMPRLITEAASRGIEVCTCSTSGWPMPTLTSSESDSESVPGGMTFPKTSSAVAAATAC